LALTLPAVACRQSQRISLERIADIPTLTSTLTNLHADSLFLTLRVDALSPISDPSEVNFGAIPLTL
jgi:hypothetical protein